jgi:dihydrofolate reductase
MKVSLIAAMSKNRVIGKDNKLPWHIPEDFRYFKEKTLKKHVIMGRKTYESIGKLLPDRTNIIITRKLDYVVDGAIIVNSIGGALGFCTLTYDYYVNPDCEVMIIGGGEIYKEALKYANKIYLTIVNIEIDGDAFFPELDGGEWKKVNTEEREGDPSFSFNEFERIV